LDAIDVLEKLYRRALRWIDQGSLRKATLVLANSCFAWTAIQRVYDVEAKVCYHGVDADLFRPQELSRNGSVLSVGALTSVKGFDFVIGGLATIPAERQPRLILVSNYQDPCERAYLEHLAREREVGVVFHTMVDEQQLVKLYNQAVLTVYAPIREPFGMVPLESMACGTPVVGVREGGVRETVVDGQTGILVDRDPEEFGRAVRTLLEDEELAERYGFQGRGHVVEKWTWEQAVQRLERHLSSVAARATESLHQES
jgi:glycosyltransferase involved in cell wall biosynthesis